MEYITCDKLKDVFNDCVCGFAYMNKLGNLYIRKQFND